MKLKKEYFLLAGVIVALALYLSLRTTDRTHYELPDLKPLDSADITSISIKGADHSIELKKESGKWLIYPEKYPADSSKVEPMIDAVKDLKVTALVSDSENSYQRYDLGPEKGISVAAGSGGKTLRAFDIGKTAPSSRHTFVKLKDDANVYHARGNFRSPFETPVDELRDKTVLAFESGAVNQIEITRGSQTRKLDLKAAPAAPDAAAPGEKTPKAEGQMQAPARDDKMAWQDETGAAADEGAVKKLLDEAALLKCREFIDGKTKADLTDPIYTLKLQAGEDKVVSLSIFAKQGEDAVGYPAVSSGSDYPFLLSSGKADAIMAPLTPETQPKE